MKQIKKYWYLYFSVLISLIVLLAFTHYVRDIFDLTTLPFIAFQAIGLLICSWWLLHITSILNMQQHLLLKYTNTIYQRVFVLIVVILMIVGIAAVDNIEYSAFTEVLISIILGYYWAIAIHHIVLKLKFHIDTKENALNKKQFNRVLKYISANNCFLVTDFHKLNIHTVKVYFPEIYQQQLLEIVSFYLKQPKHAYLISKMFQQHIKFDMNNNLYIDDKLETNPSKVGLFFMNILSENSISEININIDNIK